MSTDRQAEDVLRHTFRQLEKMLEDAKRQETASPRPLRSVEERRKDGDNDGSRKTEKIITRS